MDRRIATIWILSICCFAGLVMAQEGGPDARGPALRAQAEKQKFELTELRKKKHDPEKLFSLLNGLASTYIHLGDTETAKGYEREIESLRAGHPGVLAPSPRKKDLLRKRIAIYEAILTDNEKGGRSYQDAYLALQNLIANHVILGEKDRARKWNDRLEGLKRKYPDLVSTPPTAFSDSEATERKAKEREEAERAQRKEERKRRALVYQDGNRVALWYSAIGKIEFYKLPEGVGVYGEQTGAGQVPGELRKPGYGLSGGMIKFYHEDSVSEIKTLVKGLDPTIKVYRATREEKPPPTKVLSLEPGLIVINVGQTDTAYLLLCVNPDGDFRRPNLRLPDFCGVLSLEGDVLFKLPVKQNPPTTIARAFDVAREGPTALFGIGEPAESSEGSVYIGNIREALIWEYPDKVDRFDPKNPNDGQRELLKRFKRGLTENILRK